MTTWISEDDDDMMIIEMIMMKLPRLMPFLSVGTI